MENSLFLSIVIPAYNEEKRITRAIEETSAYIKRKGYSGEIIVVNDASIDKTAEVVTNKAKELNNLRLIDLRINQQKGGAVKAGVLAARGQYILMTDADLSTPIEELEKLLQKIREEDYDIAIGSRGVEGSLVERRQTPLREFLGKAFGSLTRALVLRDIEDTQCGFKLFKQKAAREIFPKQTSLTPIWDIEVLLIATKMGYQIAEVPVVWRHDPQSKIRYNLRRAIGAFLELLRIKAKVESYLAGQGRNLERVACNLCGKDNPQVFLEKDGYWIVRCRHCGLLYVNPRDRKEELNKVYARAYFQLQKLGSRDEVGYRDYIADGEVHRIYFKNKIAQIKRYKKGGKLLDVGCATGYFLEVAKEEGFDVFGVDVSPFAVELAKKRLGKDRIHLGDLEGSKFETDFFDVVAMFQTVEHLPDPTATLIEVRRVLRPAGLLVVATPHQGGVLEKLLGKNWFGYKPKEHPYYFNRKSLKDILEKAGFKEISVRADDFRPYPLHYVLERLEYHFPDSLIGRTAKVLGKHLRLVRRLDLSIPIFLDDLLVFAEE